MRLVLLYCWPPDITLRSLNIMAILGLSMYLAVAGLLGFYLARYVVSQRNKLPLPPGPKPWPLLGNVTDLPPPGQPEWKHWLKFKDLYGPISSITVLGQTLIIIHDKEAASELMEKRAGNYSSRPYAPFADGMCETLP